MNNAMPKWTILPEEMLNCMKFCIKNSIYSAAIDTVMTNSVRKHEIMKVHGSAFHGNYMSFYTPSNTLGQFYCSLCLHHPYVTATSNRLSQFSMYMYMSSLYNSATLHNTSFFCSYSILWKVGILQLCVVYATFRL